MLRCYHFELSRYNEIEILETVPGRLNVLVFRDDESGGRQRRASCTTIKQGEEGESVRTDSQAKK